MQSITLDNGFKFQAFWRGREVSIKGGPQFCQLRKYHDLTLMDVDGKLWIKEYQQDENHPQESCAHHEYLSVCGWYKIDCYHDSYGKPHFHAYKASTYRANMQSTFGIYVGGLRGRTFETFEDAAKAVNEHINLN